MSWLSGVFSRLRGSTACQDDEQNSIGIESGRMDEMLNDLATGINSCVNKDGTNAFTGNLNAGNNRIVSLATAVAATDATTAAQVQNSGLIYGSTSAGTANAQTVSLTPALTAYTAGQIYSWISGVENTGAMTLNINSLGTKTVKKYIGGAKYDLIDGDMPLGHPCLGRYDGTDIVFLNPQYTQKISRSDGGSISNSTTETTLITKTIKGGTMGLNRGVKLVFTGSYLNNTGSVQSIIYRIKFGSTTIYTFTLNTVSSANYAYVYAECLVKNKASASIQQTFCNMTAPTSGFGLPGSGEVSGTTLSTGYLRGCKNTASINTASDQSLVLTVQHGAASASLTCFIDDSYIELI